MTFPRCRCAARRNWSIGCCSRRSRSTRSFIWAQEVAELKVLEDHTFLLRTSRDTRFHARTVIIAGGLGSFQPRRLGVEGCEAFEGRHVHYKVKNAAEFTGKRLVIFGGGDSALDWTLEFAGKARSVTLVHRRPEFRAAPASVAKMRDLVAHGSMRYVEAIAHSLMIEGDAFRGVRVKTTDGADRRARLPIMCWCSSACIPSSDRSPSGASASTSARSTSTRRNSRRTFPGVFAVGDINTYPGKKKLILSGFHEAALAAFAVAAHLNPAKKIPLQYTTTSPIMHKRLGVVRADR